LRLDNSENARLATGRSPSSVMFPFHALHELVSDILSALMVATVWQTSADFLKHYVDIRGCPFFDFGHLTPRSVIEAINRRKFYSSSVHFFVKGVGVLPS
jgi:hypothetical protein